MAKAIVQAVQQQEPPGRFLELADKDSGTWKQITYKRSVDKTSQALREKDQPGEKIIIPVIIESNPTVTNEVAQLAAAVAAKKSTKKSTDLSDLAKSTLRQAGLDEGAARKGNAASSAYIQHHHQPYAAQQLDMDRKRKAQESAPGMMKPSWRRQGVATPPSLPVGGYSGHNNMPQPQVGDGPSAYGQSSKRMKTGIEDPSPLPPEPLEARQSSLFRFLNGSGIFGKTEGDQQMTNPNQMDALRNRRSSGFFSFTGGSRNSYIGSQMPNPSDLISMEAAAFEGDHVMGGTGLPLNSQQSIGLSNLDPLPVNGGNNGKSRSGVYGDDASKNTHRARSVDSETDNASLEDGVVPPPMNSLSAQVSDWLTSFWLLNKEQEGTPAEQQGAQYQQREQEAPPPPPTGENLERSVSSTIFNFARSPSQFLNNLKSGVTSIFGGDDFTPVPVSQFEFTSSNSNVGNNSVPQGNATAPMMGTASSHARDSLLDDYEETPLETRLRSVTSR